MRACVRVCVCVDNLHRRPFHTHMTLEGQAVTVTQFLNKVKWACSVIFLSSRGVSARHGEGAKRELMFGVCCFYLLVTR